MRRLDLILHAEALALDEDGLGMVEQTVEQRQGQRGVVVEDIRPVLVGPIGRYGERAALVALADDLEQKIGAELVDGQIAQLVQQKQRGFQIAAERLLQAAGALRGGKRVDEIDGGGEQHRIAALAGGAAQRHTQVRLAQANPSDEDDVGFVLDEAQAK